MIKDKASSGKTNSKAKEGKSRKKAPSTKKTNIKALDKKKTTKTSASRAKKVSDVNEIEAGEVAIKRVPKTPTKKINKPDVTVQEKIEKPTKPLVILQILPELNSGGVERGTVEIAKAGLALGHKMLVASAGGQMVTSLENAKITHIKLPLDSKNPFVIWANIRRIKNIINEYNVDVVHARSRAPAWSAYFAAKKAKCHFITTFHGTYSIGNPFKRAYNSIMAKGEVVIAISEFIKNHIIENYNVDESKIRVVQRGVDLSHFTRDKVHKFRIINMVEKYRIELDVPVILMPGRFTRWKGQSCLIDALSHIKDEKFVCILAGYDKKHENYYKELEKQVKELGLFHKVRMIGEVKDMPALYSLSDIVISASTRPEAFGRVAVEGQAMEKMVVATSHGGSCESVIDGKTGWLVAPGDVQELSLVLRNLLNIETEKRLDITSKARKNIENNFSLDNMVKKTFAIYNEVLEGEKL